MQLKNALRLSKNSNRGVSPVIGVILTVVITVILAGVISIAVLGLGGEVNEGAPQASFDSSYETTTTTITHTTGDTIDKSNVKVFVGGGDGQAIGSGELSAGSTIEIQNEDGSGDPATWNGEEIRVVYNDGQGNSQTLYTDTAPVKDSPVPAASFDFSFNSGAVDMTHTGSESISASNLKVYVDSTDVTSSTTGLSGDIANGDTISYDNAGWDGETVTVKYDDGTITETLSSDTAPATVSETYDTTTEFDSIMASSYNVDTSGDSISLDGPYDDLTYTTNQGSGFTSGATQVSVSITDFSASTGDGNYVNVYVYDSAGDQIDYKQEGTSSGTLVLGDGSTEIDEVYIELQDDSDSGKITSITAEE